MSVCTMPATPAPDRVSAPVRSEPTGRERAPRKPPWLKVPLPGGEGYTRLKRLTRELKLHTVCEEARCPNIGECWSGEQATMTIMVLGSECTRRCRFCAVDTVERAAAPDPAEPAHVGEAVAVMGPAYVVITSVDRDDLPDGGAAHYALCLEEIRRRAPDTLVETLIPDYTGEDLALLMKGRPDVLAHNVEVVERLQRRIRDPRCSFSRSLETLRSAKRLDPDVLTKSSLMLGLGERDGEVREALERLREAGVDLLTLGQYLRPTANHAPVLRYIEPERFEEWGRVGRELGFANVASGPLVRSSYKAGEFFAARLIHARRRRARPASELE